MGNLGWEIKPLGWIALIVVIGIILYFFFKVAGKRVEGPRVLHRFKETETKDKV